MFLVPLLIIIFVIWFLVYLFRAVPSGRPTDTVYSNNSPVNPSNKPLEILKERYAKGEISEEEYLKIKRNLT